MNGHILLVEDNPSFVDNLSEILTDLGYQVRTATSCEAARKQGKNWVQVALVDFRLPDGDGTLLAEELKGANPECEVVLLTGHASVESAAAAVRAGVWDYLVKPCATPDLLATVSKAIHHVQTHAENRELSRRAQAAERLASVGTLTAGLSHEIRNPLNAASLQLAVLERRVRKLDEKLQQPLLDPLKLVRDEIHRLEHILHDFLQFARPAPVTMLPFSMLELLAGITALLTEQAQRRNVKLELLLPELPEMKGDSHQLKQVFMNLAINALDACPDGGRVVLTASVEVGAVRVSVEDSGSGITAEQRERIFEPFFSTKPQGSGLGLPISHAIISQHGGRIEVHGSGLGGARFDVVLPTV